MNTADTKFLKTNADIWVWVRLQFSSLFQQQTTYFQPSYFHAISFIRISYLNIFHHIACHSEFKALCRPDVLVQVSAQRSDLPLYRFSSSTTINVTVAGSELLGDPFIFRLANSTVAQHFIKRCYVITEWHICVVVKPVSIFRYVLH